MYEYRLNFSMDSHNSSDYGVLCTIIDIISLFGDIIMKTWKEIIKQAAREDIAEIRRRAIESFRREMELKRELDEL